MSQRRHEAPSLGKAISRMLRSLVDRAAEGDTEAIEELQRLQAQAGTLLRFAVRRAHDEAGYSWTDLGRVLGTTRQAAAQLAGHAEQPARLD